MKTFVCDYHLNYPTTFLHHQIQVCSTHARIIDLGYKNAFSISFGQSEESSNEVNCFFTDNAKILISELYYYIQCVLL